MTHLSPSNESAMSLFNRAITQKSNDLSFIMLNLIRFKPELDYSPTDLNEGEQARCPASAFSLYIEKTRPFLEQSGGELLLVADAGSFFVGPQAEQWDKVMLVRQKSAQDFFAFAQNPDYQRVLAHRLASIDDSRLLPLFDCDVSWRP